ncbi:MAG TPA: three-Cys-motif partner protein TcmP [Chitinophagaceae bacterium]|nr:three-Cys-motif partner protein TcmP [Chitinophagaceae bacterium]
MSSKNKFGGSWTEIKIAILETYAKQFLTVFKNQPNQKLLYFDGFAGSGDIEVDDSRDDSKYTIEGAAIRILKIDKPRGFNMYYFGEKKKSLASSLETKIRKEFDDKKCYVQAEDCNKKLKDLAKFLRTEKGKPYKVLGFIDPKGMQLEWSSVEILRGLPIDLWILNPTSGANRVLVRRGEIDESWLNRLELFLGMNREEIKNHFYSKRPNLFGDLDIVKENDPINRLHEIYASRIAGNIFKYVSNPKILKNNSGSPLFHFFMATNSEIALRIANSVVNPKLGF